MTLATFSDANRHLDQTKIQFRNDADAEDDATSADAVVLAALEGIFPDDAGNWDANPTGNEVETPDIIREITGLLMAAYRYQRKYSEESVDPTSYGVMLETRAMTMLDGIRTGSLVIPGLPAPTDLNAGDFFPNDNFVVTPDNPQVGLNIGDQDRKFGMDRVF